MKKLMIVFATLLIATSAIASNPAKKEAGAPKGLFDDVYREASSDEIELVREAMQTQLKDADSAKFRNVRIISVFSVCGHVNSKNSMGAYAGYSTFFGVLVTNQTDHAVEGILPGKSVVRILFLDDADHGVALKMCRETGAFGVS